MRQVALKLFASASVVAAVPSAQAATLYVPYAVVSGGNLDFSFSSNDVCWAPVLVKGNLTLTDITATVNTSAHTVNLAIASGTTAFNGAGYTSAQSLGQDKWLRWQASGLLYRDSVGTNLFPSTINGVTVYDVFSQLRNSSLSSGYYPFGSAWGISGMSLTRYDSLIVPNTPGLFFDLFTSGSTTYASVGSGAFVQNSTTAQFGTSSVESLVNDIINNGLDYTAWKSYAIANNWYFRPNSSGTTPYVNSSGQTLYVQPNAITGPTLTTNSNGGTYSSFTSLDQISRKSLVPSGGNTYSMVDRPLFIDTKEGLATNNGGTAASITLGSASSFFWKGLIYVNGNFTTSGIGNAATVLVQNPDQFASDPTSSSGYTPSGCFLDGILYYTGSFSRSGNSLVYGSVIPKSGGSSFNAFPNVCFNSRLATGSTTVPVGLSALEVD